MKTIVVVFMRSRNGVKPEKDTPAVPHPMLARSEVVPARLPEHPESDQPAAPFWMWFIENPRHCSI